MAMYSGPRCQPSASGAGKPPGPPDNPRGDTGAPPQLPAPHAGNFTSLCFPALAISRCCPWLLSRASQCQQRGLWLADSRFVAAFAETSLTAVAWTVDMLPDCVSAAMHWHSGLLLSGQAAKLDVSACSRSRPDCVKGLSPYCSWVGGWQSDLVKTTGSIHWAMWLLLCHGLLPLGSLQAVALQEQN